MIPRSSGLTLRIFLASAALALVVASVFAVLMTAVSHLRTASREAGETERVIANADRAEKLVIDLETGERGFLITRHNQFLQPYNDARRDLPATIGELKRLVADDPVQRSRVTRLSTAIRDYQRHWAAPLITLARYDAKAARSLAATEEGKHRVDAMRRMFGALLVSEQRLSDERRARADGAGRRADWLALAGIGATFLLILLFATYLRRLVVRPVRAIAACARRRAAGELGVRAPTTGAGEVGHLARDFNSMAVALEAQREQLSRQNTDLQAVLDSTLDGIVMTDLEGNILFANEKMDRFWAALNLPTVGNVWDRLLRLARMTTTPDAYFETFGRIASDPNVVVEDEFTLAREDTSYIGHTAPVTDSSGRLVGRIFLIRDVTAERQSQRAKDEFVASVSHELRTPLTSIQGYLELVLDEAEGMTDEQRSFLRVVDRNAQRLLAVVGDLLFVAQAKAGTVPIELGAVDLAEVVRHSIDALRPVAEGKSVQMTYSGPNTLQLEADGARVAQVLDNLLSNAVKFTRDNSLVTVRVSPSPGEVVLEVADEGPGVEAADQDQLFERFFRTESAIHGAVPGTGLGLSIVRAIVEAHGGKVGVESVPGEGTTFRVALPLRVTERAA